MGKKTSQYTAKAISVLKQDGLRLSLEEIAARMGITKKTIYNHFESKDDLLTKCIQSISADFQMTMNSLDREKSNAIQNLNDAFVGLNTYFANLSPLFFYDIMRLNPNQAMSEHAIGSGIFKEKIKKNLRQGIDEGLYLPELNVEMISQYIAYSVFGFYINNVVKNSQNISNTYFEDVLHFNLRAMVTEKGRSVMESAKNTLH